MGKDPFVTNDYVTFHYPEPLNQDQQEGETNAQYEDRLARIDPDVMDDAPDERPWVKFRIPRSRADVDAVADYAQSLAIFGDNGDGAKFEQRIARGNRGIFELLAEDWSWPAKPTGANYARLDLWAGDWIVACLAQVGALGTKRDYRKKVATSSTEPSASPSSSPSEAD